MCYISGEQHIGIGFIDLLARAALILAAPLLAPEELHTPDILLLGVAKINTVC
jgi:hypothetical protein